MTSRDESYEVYETLGGTVLVFLGLGGFEGVLRLSPAGAWDFFPVGSVEWDGFHQEIYRNFRGDRLDEKALTHRGVALPPLEEYRNRPAVSWRENFRSEVALAELPPGQRGKLAQGSFEVYLVMFEDGYETSFGDGKYLYPERAFRNRAEAERFLEDRLREAAEPEKAPHPAKARWYTYTLKEVRVHVDADRVKADLHLERYEHVSVIDVLRLLNSE